MPELKNLSVMQIFVTFLRSIVDVAYDAFVFESYTAENKRENVLRSRSVISVGALTEPISIFDRNPNYGKSIRPL